MIKIHSFLQKIIRLKQKLSARIGKRKDYQAIIKIKSYKTSGYFWARPKKRKTEHFRNYQYHQSIPQQHEKWI